MATIKIYAPDLVAVENVKQVSVTPSASGVRIQFTPSGCRTPQYIETNFNYVVTGDVEKSNG